jgi:predicted ribosomally synthesized peptide with nif11-like leader
MNVNVTSRTTGESIMAQETVKTFFKQVEADQNLNDQYKSLVKGMAAANADEAAAMQQVVAFAAQQGFAFTAEDVQLAAAEMQGDELTDEELDAVAGGWGLMFVHKGYGGICVMIGV